MGRSFFMPIFWKNKKILKKIKKISKKWLTNGAKGCRMSLRG